MPQPRLLRPGHKNKDLMLAKATTHTYALTKSTSCTKTAKSEIHVNKDIYPNKNEAGLVRGGLDDIEWGVRVHTKLAAVFLFFWCTVQKAWKGRTLLGLRCVASDKKVNQILDFSFTMYSSSGVATGPKGPQ
jgi:hypothetical protein